MPVAPDELLDAMTVAPCFTVMVVESGAPEPSRNTCPVIVAPASENQSTLRDPPATTVSVSTSVGRFVPWP